MSDDRPLAEDVSLRVDEARLARQWSSIKGGLDAPRRRVPWAILAPAVALVAIVALIVARPWSSRVETPVATAAAQSVVLPDGSRVLVKPGSDFAVRGATLERVELALEDGEIDLDVTHVEGRPFVVAAAGHAITVLGTEFKVRVASRADGKKELGVEVRRGRVRVSGPSGEHVLDAGQAWSTIIQPARAIAPVDTTDAEVAFEAPDVPAPSARALPAEPSAKDLLARATEARSAGRTRDAAAAFDTLRKKHRSDPRAGLAAFELGRIRLDALGDPSGAAEAFADAIALAPSAPFREDAEARRIDALDAAGDAARCRDAKARYLGRYPSGLHAKQVEQRCR